MPIKEPIKLRLLHRKNDMDSDVSFEYTFFYIRLKSAKNQANAKEHPETELLLFENHSHPSFTLSSKNNSTYSKK